jgi:metallo-beta-lactamase class B
MNVAPRCWSAVAGGLVFTLACSVAAAPAARGQATEEWRGWDQPVEPFKIIGNVWYVGASDITSFLITTPEGHVLIDGGFVETAPQILANIRKLGFRPEDVKVLLNSHAHFDHAGGLAELKQATGAKMIASAEDAVQLERGGKGDFAFDDKYAFPPVKVDRVVADGDTVELGGTTLVAHLTPGHTKGCTTWTMRVGPAPGLAVVFLCSVSVPGYQLVDNPRWPGIVEAYESTFRKLEALPCDVFLAPHGSFFDLEAKRRRALMGMSMGGRGPAKGPAGGAGPANPFVDPQGYRDHLAKMEQAFRAELERQRRDASH